MISATHSSSSRATTPGRSSTTPCARRAPRGLRCGSSSTAAATAPPKACARSPRPIRALRVDVLARESRQGRGRAACARGRARGRLHARADDGCRTASIRPSSSQTFMAASASACGRDDPRPAGVRRVGAAPARARPAHLERWTNLETLGAGIDDSLYGFRVYPIAPLVEVMRAPEVDAPLRLRHRGGRAARVARRPRRSTSPRR